MRMLDGLDDSAISARSSKSAVVTLSIGLSLAFKAVISSAYYGPTLLNKRSIVIVLIVLLVLAMVGTALAGLKGATRRETLARARVWCDALVDRDALRYQDTFRRGYFRGHYDRFANLYREQTETQILAKMPRTKECHIKGGPRGPNERGEVFITVGRDGTRLDLRMRREAGFWVVWQLAEPA